jgi:hypothetical protein
MAMAGSESSAKRSSRARREPPPEDNPELTAADVAKSAAREVADLTGRTPVGVTAVEPTEDGWRVEVEVVEESHIPSTSDLMALYEVDLDQDGGLLAYRRTRRYVRGRADSTNGATR